MQFSLEVAVTLSIILMFGVAYSMARDNETSVSKNINFMPLSKTKYIFSKTLPFVLLGFLELILVLLIGHLVFNINYQINVVAIFLISMLFVASTTLLGALFGSFKSQIACVFFDMLAIILPMFVISTTLTNTLTLPVQIFLYFFPIVPFVLNINAMMFNGIVNWMCVVILVLQIIVFYIIIYLVIKRRVNGR